LNGVTAIVVALLASDNRFQAATKIAAAIDLNASYTATASQGVVTVIALPGTQVDATFADTDTTGTAVTITVVVQGKAGSDLTSAVTVTIPDSVNYVVGKGQLVVFLDGIFQVLGSNYTEASSTTVEFIADTLSDGSEITFIVFDSSKIDYSASYTYDGSNRIQTVTYTGDLAKTVTYTYDASNNVATRVTVEDGVTTTDTYSYVDGKIDTISSVAV
jgi:hypothetical protein